MAGPIPIREKPDARYFLALRPAPEARRELGELALAVSRQCGGRAIGADDVHLTVVFVGQAPRSLEPELRDAAGALGPAGPLRLARLGSFGPRLLWIGPAETPVWLEEMSDALRGELDRRQIAFDRKAFRAHVTLVRGARPSARCALDALQAGLAAIEFGASRVRLVESLARPGAGRYRWFD